MCNVFVQQAWIHNKSLCLCVSFAVYEYNHNSRNARIEVRSRLAGYPEYLKRK